MTPHEWKYLGKGPSELQAFIPITKREDIRRPVEMVRKYVCSGCGFRKEVMGFDPNPAQECPGKRARHE